MGSMPIGVGVGGIGVGVGDGEEVGVGGNGVGVGSGVGAPQADREIAVKAMIVSVVKAEFLTWLCLPFVRVCEIVPCPPCESKRCASAEGFLLLGLLPASNDERCEQQEAAMCGQAVSGLPSPAFPENLSETGLLPMERWRVATPRGPAVH